jgi:hypothetical protein
MTALRKPKMRHASDSFARNTLMYAYANTPMHANTKRVMHENTLSSGGSRRAQLMNGLLQFCVVNFIPHRELERFSTRDARLQASALPLLVFVLLSIHFDVGSPNLRTPSSNRIHKPRADPLSPRVPQAVPTCLRSSMILNAMVRPSKFITP